jgi:hypothetical protein
MASTFANAESGLSVRNKINTMAGEQNTAAGNITTLQAQVAGLSAGASLPSNYINVLAQSGVVNNNTNATATRAGINAAIAICNASSTPTRLVLYFPPGEYAINGPLTTADGDYSIIMDPSATLRYVPSDQTSVGYNIPMWTIGSRTFQNDGQGIRVFVLAAEGGGAGQLYTQDENVAFDFINIDHCTIVIRRANEFMTGLRMTANAAGAGNDGKHMFDVTVGLGYFHTCHRHLVQRTIENGWMNNIRYYGGDFAPSSAASSGNLARYISMRTEGTIGVAHPTPNSRGGENKAVFHDPLCDGANFTALYVRGGSAMVHGGHMENPTWVIEHEAGQATPAGGDEPYVWIAPRLEAKQFKISDPDNVGSYAHDPFWGAAPKSQPKAIPGTTYSVNTGDVRTGRLLYSAASNVVVTIPDFGSGALEPPLMAEVKFQRRGAGTLTIQAGSGAGLLVPRAGPTYTVVARGTVTASLIDLNEPVTANQVWALTGDLT